MTRDSRAACDLSTALAFDDALAEVLGAVRRHNINVETMHNTIFQGARAACARIRLGTRPSAELLAEIREQRDAIIHVDVIELPDPAP